MTALTTVDSVLNLMRQDAAPDINQAITSVLDLVSLGLESEVKTQQFDRFTGYDIFHLEPTNIPKGIDVYKWRLSNGFVDNNQPFTVKVGILATDFGLTNPPNPVLDITANCNIQYEMGLVDILGGPLVFSSLASANYPTPVVRANFVRIDYTSGFTETNGVYDEVPSWLSTAAVLYTIKKLDHILPTLRNPKGGGLSSAKAPDYSHGSLIGRHARYRPQYQNPAYTFPG